MITYITLILVLNMISNVKKFIKNTIRTRCGPDPRISKRRHAKSGKKKWSAKNHDRGFL